MLPNAFDVIDEQPLQVAERRRPGRIGVRNDALIALMRGNVDPAILYGTMPREAKPVPSKIELKSVRAGVTIGAWVTVAAWTVLFLLSGLFL